MKLVPIASGSFQMGQDGSQTDYEMKKHPEESDRADWDEKPVHRVTLTQPFHMSVTEVTLREFRQFAPDFRKGKGLPDEAASGISWHKAVEFCQWLSKKEGKAYRLPTEAEWEYAAKGGNRSSRYNYSGSHNLNLVGWYWDNSSNRTSAVGTKQANELGLCDMSGNVWEWCSDWYGPYSAEQQVNPQGPENGVCRVLRGGSCFFGLSESSSEFRNLGDPVGRGYDCGFRLVLPANP